MQAHLADLFPDSAATLTFLWRHYQLEYTWRATCQETYEPFEIITEKALAHALLECGEEATKKDLYDIMCKYETLEMYLHDHVAMSNPRFSDVEKTLQILKDQDIFDLYLFSNGSHITLKNAQ